jgi:hypothetical protein
MPTDSAPGDRFGNAVALHGDTLLVGASKANALGVAYVFGRDPSGRWTQKERLGAPASVSRNFGQAVALYGDTAVVGSEGSDGSPGMAHVFSHDEAGRWELRQTLMADDAGANDKFGTAISLSGNTLLIGAKGSDTKGIGSGAAYVFQKLEDSRWVQQAQLSPDDGKANSFFGSAVGLTHNLAVIGADGDDQAGPESGAAYVMTLDDDANWIEIGKLLPSEGPALEIGRAAGAESLEESFARFERELEARSKLEHSPCVVGRQCVREEWLLTMASEADNLKAQTLKAPPELCALYLYATKVEWESFPSSAFVANVDGTRVLAFDAEDNYVRWLLDPGSHSLSVEHRDKTRHLSGSRPLVEEAAPAKFNCVAGEVLAYKVAFSAWRYASKDFLPLRHYVLSKVSPEEARSSIQERDLVVEMAEYPLPSSLRKSQ